MVVQAVVIGNTKAELLFYRNYAGLGQSFVEDSLGFAQQIIQQDKNATFFNSKESRVVFLVVEELLLLLVVD